MSSLCSSALKSLDDSLALLWESLEKLKAAEAVDIAEVIEQLKMTAECARVVRELVWSELPETSWQNREELDALIEKIQKSLAARTLEQLRSRLLALATELERGNIVHRRAHRLNELNQLRDQAINELRSQAGLEGAPQTLPGPQADQWIQWACGLKEPQDAESLQTLRHGFAHLDDFVANLEPNMWIAAGSPTLEILPAPERSADQTPSMPSEVLAFADALSLPLAEPSPPVEAPYFPWMDNILEQGELEIAKSSGGRDEPRLPDLLDELSLPALESNTPTPNDVTPPQIEEVTKRMLAQERALLASMMGLDSNPVERPFTAEAFRETSAAPAIASAIRTGVEEPWGGKWRMLLATVAVLVIAALGAIQWRSLRNHTSNGPVKAIERKIPDLTRSSLEDKGYGQSGMSTDSEAHTSSPMTQTEEQSKPQDQSVAPRPLSKVSPAKRASELDDGVLRPPAATPRSIAVVKKEEAPPNGTTEMPGSIPGGLPNGVPNSVINIVRDTPGALPKVTAEKVRVSSGVVQGLLIHQVTPQYPPQARRAGIQGTVVLQVLIGKDGTVQNLHVLSGHPMLIQAAMDAVRKWRYKPYYLNGEPVEADSQISVNFTL